MAAAGRGQFTFKNRRWIIRKVDEIGWRAQCDDRPIGALSRLQGGE